LKNQDLHGGPPWHPNPPPCVFFRWEPVRSDALSALVPPGSSNLRTTYRLCRRRTFFTIVSQYGHPLFFGCCVRFFPPSAAVPPPGFPYLCSPRPRVCIWRSRMRTFFSRPPFPPQVGPCFAASFLPRSVWRFNYPSNELAPFPLALLALCLLLSVLSWSLSYGLPPMFLRPSPCPVIFSDW